MPTPSPYTTLGKIGKTYGVKGWFNVVSFTDPIENIFEYTTWYLKNDSQWEAFELEAFRPHGKGYIAKLPGYDTPENSRLLTNREIGVPTSELPTLANNEYYWSDLIDLEVYTAEGQLLGKVTQVLETGANEVLCVQGERERMVPFIKSVIQKVDLEQKRITVNWDPDF